MIADGLGRLEAIAAELTELGVAEAKLLTERRDLAARLHAEGVTLQVIADAAGVSRQRVHAWLTGE